jgi:glycylpeptide N-tetradecanoyltransferase
VQQEGSGPAEGPIDPPKTVADIKPEPYALPPGFVWCTVDVKVEEQVG